MSLPNSDRTPQIDITCPYCGKAGQELEDAGDHPAYLSGTCWNCDKDFSVNVYTDEYFDNKGNRFPEPKEEL